LGRFFSTGKAQNKIFFQKKFMQALQIFNSRNRDALDVIVPPPSCFFSFFGGWVGGLGGGGVEERVSLVLSIDKIQCMVFCQILGTG
jgi:hypothetical protein